MTGGKKPGRRLFLAGGALALLAAAVQLLLTGYGMTALCCLFAAGCCFFFGLTRRRGTKTAQVLSRAAGVCIALGLCLFLAAEIPVLADARSDEDTSAGYLIVMGAGVNGQEPSLSLENRLDAALVWLEENPGGTAVLSGGQGRGESLSEAEVMYRWLTARGVAPERLLREERASDSYENLLYSLALIEAQGGDPTGRVALLSSEYHLHRLRYMAEKLGCEPVCVAARTTRLTLMMNYAVREAFAVWKCWLFGIQ